MGSALLVVTVVLVVVSVLAGRRGADDDAWGRGQTLEWATASPPTAAGFGVLETGGVLGAAASTVPSTEEGS